MAVTIVTARIEKQRELDALRTSGGHAERIATLQAEVDGLAEREAAAIAVDQLLAEHDASRQ
jgi:hypothetical protein